MILMFLIIKKEWEEVNYRPQQIKLVPLIGIVVPLKSGTYYPSIILFFSLLKKTALSLTLFYYHYLIKSIMLQNSAKFFFNFCE